MTHCYKRTVEDTLTVLDHAKLEDSELKYLTQVLYSKETCLSDNDYKFIELEEPLLSKLREGQSLIFRGENHESAVMCSEDTTYEVKEAETSNSMLLMSGLKLPSDIDDGVKHRTLEERQVLGVFSKYLEVRMCKPRLQKLMHILHDSQYRGKEYEEELLTSPNIKFYTFNNLLDVIQASEVELRNALKELLICQIGDNLRLLEHDYQFQVLSFIIKVVDENSWPHNGLVKTVTQLALSDLVQEDILDQVFDWFTVSTGANNEGGQTLYKFDEHRVCRFIGGALLRQVDRFNLEEFLTIWQQSVPESMTTGVEQLDGLALYDTKSKPHAIWLYPEANLPEDVTERFRELFKTREKWTLNEIRPYVERLALEQMNVNALLTKYARSSTVAGTKYFSAKHGTKVWRWCYHRVNKLKR